MEILKQPEKKTKQNPGPRRKVFKIERNQPKNRGTFAALAMPPPPAVEKLGNYLDLGDKIC